MKTRSAIAARDGSRWPRGVPLMAYGLWFRDSMFRERRQLILVEGETDALTGWLYNLPVLGIPGASTVRSTLAADVLTGIDTVYVVQEPDVGGRNFVNGVSTRLRELGFNGTAAVVRFEGVKDLNELQIAHAQSPERFLAAFNAAVAGAVPLSSVSSLVEVAHTVEWGEPQELPGRSIEVPPFRMELLPESLRPWLADTSERMGCPPEFPPVGAIIALSNVGNSSPGPVVT